MNFILAIPIELRLAMLFVAGAGIGAAVNLFVDRLRWETPRHSPWNEVVESLLRRLFGASHDDKKASRQRRQTDPAISPEKQKKSKRKDKNRRERGRPNIAPRNWLDLLPIVGWLSLSRETPKRGLRFWVRPCLIELLCGLAVMVLYWWEVQQWKLIPLLLPSLSPPPHLPEFPQVFLQAYEIVHLQYLSHVILIAFMLAASLIDLDEWLIPDPITVTGTVAGLALAIAAPVSLLPRGPEPNASRFIHMAAPHNWPAALDGGQWGGLALALGCVWMWCFAHLPRTWRSRRGLALAAGLFWLRLVRERWTYWVLILGALITGGVLAVWRSGEPSWTALLSSLVGLAVGGGVIWLVRILCSAVLGKEAMGFGDVTLMAMIGAFLGWQACVLIFFLSPFFGLIPPGLALLSRSKVPAEVPYGPFLCLASVTIILCWSPIWERAAGLLFAVGPLFEGWFLLAFVGASLVMMIVLLAAIQFAKRLFRRSA